MRSHHPPSWLVLSLFVLFGPPIGALSISAWVHFGLEPIETIESIDLGFVFALAFFTYVYGSVPALVAGGSAALMAKVAFGQGAAQVTLRIAAPVLLGAIWSVAVSLFLNGPDAFVSVAFAASGALAALSCATLIECWVRLRPNSSLKRTDQSLRD